MQSPDWTKADIRTLHRVNPMRSDITMHGIARGARPAAQHLGRGTVDFKGQSQRQPI
jgi:hypothetical protein